MGTYTTNLNLYNTNMLTDGNDTFDFQRDINDNNDKIDSAVGNLSTLNTTEQGSIVGAINEVISNCGALTNLSTTAKTNLVSAINELVGNLDGFASKSLGNLNSTGQAVIDKKVEIEALLATNGYAKFTWKQNNQTSKIIVQWGTTTVVAVTLPISYSNTGYGIALANEYASSNYIADTIKNGSIAKTGFDILGANTANEKSHWITVGY